MARLPRLTVAAYPHHIILRGNNGQAIFQDDDDYQRLLRYLSDFALEQKVAVHAYVLMGNQVHLLLTPATNEGVPRMMQALGRRYVRYFNDRHGRTGTLWEGRYRCGLLEADRYLLACMACLDLNPVRSGMASAPQDYPWSSYSHYAGLRSDPLLTPHALYWQMGNTPFAREAAYADWVKEGVSATLCEKISRAALGGLALGEADFIGDLQRRTARRVTPGRPGRPALKSRQANEEAAAERPFAD